MLLFFLCFHPLLCLHKALCSPRGKNSNKKSARRAMYRFLSSVIVRVLCLMLNGCRKLKVFYLVSKLIVTTFYYSWRIDVSVLLSDQVWITNESNNSKKNDKDKELAVVCHKKLLCRNWDRKWNRLTNLLNHTIGLYLLEMSVALSLNFKTWKTLWKRILHCNQL